MVYEADPSWEGPHPRPSSFSTRSATAATADPTPNNVRFGENESVLNVNAPPKGRRVAFDFSTFQRQHEEAARTLATFSSAGSGVGAATATAAPVPQAAAGGQHTGLGREVMVMTTTTSSAYNSYPVAAVSAANPVLGGNQPQQERQQQPLQQQHLGVAHAHAPRPRLVVGPGRFGGKVGLLTALQPPELTKYLTPKEGGAAKPPRAPRTDLSHLTEEEKGDRHRKQSRRNGQFKRDQFKLVKTRLKKDVEQMRTYQNATDMAPFVKVVLSAIINDCRVLYVNKSVTEKLGHEVDKFLGSSFLMMVHPQDRHHLASVLNECIYASQPSHGRVVCRFWCIKGIGNNHQQPFKQMDMTVNIGTKGLICNLWEVRGPR